DGAGVQQVAGGETPTQPGERGDTEDTDEVTADDALQKIVARAGVLAGARELREQGVGPELTGGEPDLGAREIERPGRHALAGLEIARHGFPVDRGEGK